MPEISPPLNALDRQEQFRAIVVARTRHSEDYSWQTRRKLPRYYDLYRGILTGRFHAHKNNVHIPLIFSTIRASVARKMSSLFGDEPPVIFTGYDDAAGAAIARKQENLYAAQARDAGLYEKYFKLLLASELYGVGIGQTGWKRLERNARYTDIRHMPLTNRTVQTIQDGRSLDFDGPDFDVIDRLDFFEQVGRDRVRDMRYAGRRMWMDFDEVLYLAEQGVFDMAAVRELQANGFIPTEAEDALKIMRGMDRLDGGIKLSDAKPMGSKPVMLVDHHGWFPREICPDGICFRTVTVANNRYVLRNRPFPFHHGRLDWLFPTYAPEIDPHYFNAPGKAEISEKLQIAANKFTNQYLDGLEVGIDPYFFVNRAAALDPRGLYLKPGRFITVDGPPGEMVQAAQPNLQGLQAGIQSSQTLWRWMQQGTGIAEDVVMGLAGPDRETARGFLGRSEAAASRIAAESMLAQIGIVEPVADCFMDLDRQFLEPPREYQILGSGMTKDPVTGNPVPTTKMTIDFHDLTPRYRAQARGLMSQMSKANAMQNTLTVFQVMGNVAKANPQLLAQVNWIGWLRLLARRAGDAAEINELINATPAVQQGIINPGMSPGLGPNAQSVLPGLAQGPPGQLPALPGAPMTQVSPQDVGAMLGSMANG